MRVGAHVAALVHDAVERARRASGRFRMKAPSAAGIVPHTSSMRGCMNSVIRSTWSGPAPISLLDAAEARGARLQVGDADHVVVGHGVGDVFRRLDGEAETACRPAVHRGRGSCSGFSRSR